MLHGYLNFNFGVCRLFVMSSLKFLFLYPCELCMLVLVEVLFMFLF